MTNLIFNRNKKNFLKSLIASTTLFSMILGSGMSLPLFAYASNGGSGNDNDHKVQICHIPQGNPSNMQTIEVDGHSVTYIAHLKHGDGVGPCVVVPPPHENEPPVITLLGISFATVTLGGIFVDPSATVADPEEGNITNKLVTTGIVDTNTIGSYVITYNATDTQNLAAETKTRTVNVISTITPPPPPPPNHKVNICHIPLGHPENMQTIEVDENSASYTAHLGHGDSLGACVPPPPPPNPECSDGVNNDNDALSDFPVDLGCDDSLDNDENDKPVITLRGVNPMQVALGSTYTEPSADVDDAEDGDIDANLVITGSVNTAVIGSYTVTYNAADSENLSAVTKTRTVNVVAACSDGADNDGDTKNDFPLDLGCEDPTDNNENDRPVITLLGDVVMNIFVNTTFTDPNTTASDTEDGDITSNIVVAGTVNPTTLGTYTLTYDVNDSQGLAALQKTRTVNVNPAVTECNDNIDNDNDNSIDFDGAVLEGDMAFIPDAGCDSPEDNSENERPVITVSGSDPLLVNLGTTYTDPGRTAFDPEDSDITANIVDGGDIVNTAVLGTYVVTYNAVDSLGLSAVEKSRTVRVVASCSDGRDNDGDSFVDFPLDPGCDSPEDDGENSKPIITLLGDIAMQLVVGTSYTEPSATVNDEEDGDITNKLVIFGSVDTNTIGSYVITYNATDTQNLAADTKARTVNVVAGDPGCTVNCGGGSTPPVCSDGLDNDNDGLIDFPTDTDCDSLTDISENAKPVITLLGDVVMQLVVGTSYSEPSATVNDQEEGNITNKLVTTGTVDTNTIGSYTITYNATDTQNLAADTKTRTVNIVAGNTGCTQNCGGNPPPPPPPPPPPVCTVNCGGGSSTFDYWGCTDRTALNFNALANKNDNSCKYPGEVAGTSTVPVVPPPPPTVVNACEYIKEYMRLGTNNNPVEVAKLQLFLKNFEGSTAVTVTGFFDIVTDSAVRKFQDKYKVDVLDAWNLPANTGYVYYTTKKKINEIYCQKEFPLTNAQLSEIASFRALLASFNTAYNEPTSDSQPSVIVTVNDVPGASSGVSELGDAQNVGMLSGVTLSVAERATAEPENRGRIALSELLAVPSSMAGEISDSGTATNPVTGMVAGASISKRGLAAVVDSIMERTHLTQEAIALLLLFVIVAIILAVYYGRRYGVSTVKNGVDDMGV